MCTYPQSDMAFITFCRKMATAVVDLISGMLLDFLEADLEVLFFNFGMMQL